jgi:hypothetical protein
MERKKTNIGFTGSGYDFSEKERTKVKEFRKELARSIGMGVDEDEDEDLGDEIKSV